MSDRVRCETTCTECKDSGTLNYRCRFCTKSYSRSDVLNRHVVRCHGRRGSTQGRPRKLACASCIAAKASCDGLAPQTCSRCSISSRDCEYTDLEADRSLSPTRSRAGTPYREGDLGSDIRNSPSFTHASGAQLAIWDGSVQNLNLLRDAAGVERGMLHESLSIPLAETSDTAMTFDATLTGPSDLWTNSNTWLDDLLLSATTRVDGDSWNAVNDLNPTNLAAFDWGFTDLTANIFQPIATGAPPTPSGLLSSLPVEDREPDLVVAVSAEEVDGVPNAKDLPDGRPSTSRWPNVYHPHTPELDITLPTTLAARVSLSVPNEPLVNNTARDVMQRLSIQSHKGIWPPPDLGNFPSQHTLTICVNLYLSNFSTWLPIVDTPRGTFRVDKAAPIVLKALAAVGSVYGKGGLDKLGVPLAELVRRETIFICEHDQRFILEIGIVQACLLQSYFGVYNGSPKLYQQAEGNRASLVTSCKRMHLLRCDVSALKQVLSGNRGEEEELRARKQDHRRRRLGWAIFLYDAQLACLFGTPAQLPLTDIRSPLPQTLPDYSPEPILFSQIMSSLLNDGRLPCIVEDVGYSCLAYALYRLCIDAVAVAGFASPPLDWRSTGMTFSMYEKNPLDVLDQLAQHSLASHTPSALLVSCTALSYHAHIQLTQRGYLETIKLAAGKSGSSRLQALSREEIKLRLLENPQCARHVFIYAGLLRNLLFRFSFDTPTEVIWLFDATLCLWAYARFAPVAADGDRVVVSWLTTPEIQRWMDSGFGKIYLQGMGEGSSVTAILQSTIDRFEIMSWGLAARFREVLCDLVKEM